MDAIFAWGQTLSLVVLIYGAYVCVRNVEPMLQWWQTEPMDDDKLALLHRPRNHRLRIWGRGHPDYEW